MKRTRRNLGPTWKAQVILAAVKGDKTVAESPERWASVRPPTYVWRKWYGQMAIAEIRWLRQREDENRKLKQLIADLTLDKVILQDVLANNP